MPLSLHRRIEIATPKLGDLRKYAMAAKYLGNVGSHTTGISREMMSSTHWTYLRLSSRGSLEPKRLLTNWPRGSQRHVVRYRAHSVHMLANSIR